LDSFSPSRSEVAGNGSNWWPFYRLNDSQRLITWCGDPRLRFGRQRDWDAGAQGRVQRAV